MSLPDREEFDGISTEEWPRGNGKLQVSAAIENEQMPDGTHEQEKGESAGEDFYGKEYRTREVGKEKADRL